MNFEIRVSFFGIGLDQKWLKVCVMLIVEKRSNGKQTTCVAVGGKSYLPLDSQQLDVDEDSYWIFLNLFLFVYHFIEYYPAFY